MSKSKWKIPTINLSVIKKVLNQQGKKTKLWSRSDVIPSVLINKQMIKK